MSGLPVLPGYTYDPVKQRYFPTDKFKDPSHLTRANITQEKNENFKPKVYNKNIFQHIYPHELSDPSPKRQSSITAALLSSKTRRKNVTHGTLMNHICPPLDDVCIVQRKHLSSFSMYYYPDGIRKDLQLGLTSLVPCHAFWYSKDVMLCHVSKDKVPSLLFLVGAEDGSYLLAEDRVHLCTAFPLHHRLNCISYDITRGERVAGAGSKFSVIQEFQANAASRRFHPDGSEGLCCIYRHGEVLTGTRGGHVYLYDERCHRAVFPSSQISVRASTGNVGSVCDIKRSRLNRNMIYVSGMTPQNYGADACLHAWDLRNCNEPVTYYRGHKNEYKSISFDIEEVNSGGLIASGGDDGIVRFWDLHQGGHPLNHVNCGDTVPQEVRFAGWDHGASKNNNPGAWIITNANVHIVRLTEQPNIDDVPLGSCTRKVCTSSDRIYHIVRRMR